MTIKVYISGICGSHEVRKHQQRVLFILQSLPIELQLIDITEPGRDEDLIFMQEEAKKHDKKTQLPPQIFNETEYCGDYADFELANDDDEILRFLKIETSSPKSEEVKEITQNGISDHSNNQENLGESEKPNLDNIEENSDPKDKDIELNLESSIIQEKDTIIETPLNEDPAITEEALPESNQSEEKNMEASEEEESEEESD